MERPDLMVEIQFSPNLNPKWMCSSEPEYEYFLLNLWLVQENRYEGDLYLKNLCAWTRVTLELERQPQKVERFIECLFSKSVSPEDYANSHITILFDGAVSGCKDLENLEVKVVFVGFSLTRWPMIYQRPQRQELLFFEDITG